MTLLYKSIDCAQFKFNDEGTGGFTGYASVFNNADSYGDIVAPGAYAECLPSFVRDGWIAVGHDWGSLGVGYIADAGEDHYGLKIDTRFHSTKEGQDARTVVRERLAAGKSVSLSIGYRVPNGGRTEREDGFYDLTKVDLKEVSIVAVPANAMAVITGAKSGPHGGLTFAAHSDAVRAAVEEFVVRCQDLATLRATKEGRVLSAVTRARVAECRDAIEEATSALIDVDANLAELLAAAEPAPKPMEEEPKGDTSTLAATRQVYAEYLRSLSA